MLLVTPLLATKFRLRKLPLVRSEANIAVTSNGWLLIAPLLVTKGPVAACTGRRRQTPVWRRVQESNLPDPKLSPR